MAGLDPAARADPGGDVVIHHEYMAEALTHGPPRLQAYQDCSVCDGRLVAGVVL